MLFQQICELSGWKMGSTKYNMCHELFTELWRNLQDTGDDDLDGKVSKDEWVSPSDIEAQEIMTYMTECVRKSG